MSKCWQIRNENDSETADLLLYGPISGRTWWGDEVTPRQLASDLAALNGKDVCVRINSPGGDVFAAHAIYNQLLTYPGEVTVKIDGLAASAATIIAMAGKVIMPSNSVMMIHNPALGLLGYYTASELEKMASDLEVIKNSIIAAYLNKCNLTDKKLARLMDDETWMSAEDALEYGFADEVESNAVDMVMNGKYLVVNSIKHDISNLQGADKLKNLIKNKKGEGDKMDILDELKKLIGNSTAKNGAEPQVPAPQTVTDPIQQAVNAERARIVALDALLDSNPAVADIVNEAKQSGKTADEIKPYVDVVKKHAPAQTENNSALEFIAKLITDNKNSGAEEIKGNGDGKNDDERQELANAVNLMAGIINKKNGVKK